jgi:acetyl esterase/lipase
MEALELHRQADRGLAESLRCCEMNLRMIVLAALSLGTVVLLAQQAIRVALKHAAEWSIDPNKVGVTDQTPPTLLRHATGNVLVENGVVLQEELHRHKIAAEAVFFTKGNHDFFGIARDESLAPSFTWMIKNVWMEP